MDIDGKYYYEIKDNKLIVEEERNIIYQNSTFGATEVKIYYVDSNEKRNFT